MNKTQQFVCLKLKVLALVILRRSHRDGLTVVTVSAYGDHILAKTVYLDPQCAIRIDISEALAESLNAHALRNDETFDRAAYAIADAIHNALRAPQ